LAFTRASSSGDSSSKLTITLCAGTSYNESRCHQSLGRDSPNG
jgi:hypothetical protein